MVVRAEHVLVSCRLPPVPGHSTVGPDPALHAPESGAHCRRLHAHGLGTPIPDLRRTAATGSGARLPRHHDFRVELYTSHTYDLICDRPMTSTARRVPGGASRDQRRSHPGRIFRVTSRFHGPAVEVPTRMAENGHHR